MREAVNYWREKGNCNEDFFRLETKAMSKMEASLARSSLTPNKETHFSFLQCQCRTFRTRMLGCRTGSIPIPGNRDAIHLGKLLLGSCETESILQADFNHQL